MLKVTKSKPDTWLWIQTGNCCDHTFTAWALNATIMVRLKAKGSYDVINPSNEYRFYIFAKWKMRWKHFTRLFPGQILGFAHLLTISLMLQAGGISHSRTWLDITQFPNMRMFDTRMALEPSWHTIPCQDFLLLLQLLRWHNLCHVTAGREAAKWQIIPQLICCLTASFAIVPSDTAYSP